MSHWIDPWFDLVRLSERSQIHAITDACPAAPIPRLAPISSHGIHAKTSAAFIPVAQSAAGATQQGVVRTGCNDRMAVGFKDSHPLYQICTIFQPLLILHNSAFHRAT